MKTFEWVRVEHKTNNDVGHSLSLLEILDNGASRRFWASISLYPTPDWKYQMVAYSKDRLLKTTDIDADSIEEAQEAIEMFLMDEGVLQDGDEVISN